jgi:hypothetical protein
MNDKDLSIETSINYLSSKDSNGLSNIFALSGSSSSSVQFSLSQRKAAFINEIGVFVVSDDKGTVNGVAPGTEGYMQAALTQSRVIFSSLSERASAGINFVRQLTFKAGERLGFYLVANNTTSSVDTTSSSDNIFFSLSSCNTDKFDHVRVKDNGKSSFDLAWEDLKGGGDKDFNDLVLKMEIVKTPPALGSGLQGGKEGEILDFRTIQGQISANFTLNSDSSNRNHVGFYRINDAQGTVTDPLTGKTIRPDEVGYAQAAIRQSIVSFNQSSTSSTSIEGGGLFATYIIANGNKEQFLSLNQSNQEGSGPVAYFTYQKANPDKLQHIRQFGDNTFGFEEPEIKGKREYNYTVFKVDLSVKTEINIDIDKGSENPVVNISATNPIVTETDSATNTSTFRISRTGDTSAELAVNLDIDDTSTVTSNVGGAFAVDYSLSGGSLSGTGKTRSVIIPVGMSFVDITLTALDDTHAEADEILKLNLADGNYKVDTTNNNATVTIAANDTGVINTSDDTTGTDYTKMEGSLRQALINANAFAGTDNITFNLPTGSQTINLTGALPDINGDLTIINTTGANNLTVRRDTGGDYRIFTVNDGVNATFDGLTITNGSGKSESKYEGLILGGGIFNDGGTLTVTNSIISGNSAEFGGGIFNDGGTLTVTNNTISRNSAQQDGGGIYNYIGTLTVTNSTISANSAQQDGGGIFNNDSTLTVTNSTISGNSAQQGGGGIFNNGTVKAKNTIIAKNTANSSPDFFGTLTSQGYNLIGNVGTNNFASNTTGDVYGDPNNTTMPNSGAVESATAIDPKLGSLTNNGGSTQTMALLSGSPAINAGDTDLTSVPTTDQRGENRVKQGRIDIGAYESDLTQPT